jgi:hypothetical protein
MPKPSNDNPQYIIVPQAMYDDLRKAAMEAGYIPQQMIPAESFVDYVKRNPKPARH